MIYLLDTRSCNNLFRVLNSERDIQPLKSLCTADQNAAGHKSLSNACGTYTGPLLPIGETSSDKLENENAWSQNGTLLGFKQEPLYGAHGNLNGNVDVPVDAASCTLAQLIEDEQDNGLWPLEHPLPLPGWEDEYIAPYRLNNIREYETLACEIEMYLRKVLEEHNYDTVGNFLKLYESYKKSGNDNLLEFFHLYSPPITSEHHTCVGLAFELWNRLRLNLDSKYPGIGNHICVVSCEEEIDSPIVYTNAFKDDPTSLPYRLEKEHVMMCLKVEFSGRTAVMLCDPGYHVARVVTVMSDGAYPHTGWFIQSEEGNTRKDYNYQLTPNNKHFVEWNERTTRNGKVDTFAGIIYVGRPYLTAVDVTERRNLVYGFKSLLSRDQKGDLIAGIYFKLLQNGDEFTIFYQNMGKQRIKLRFSDFMKPEIDKGLLEKISICNEQLNLPENKLLNIIRTSGTILRDTSFLLQLLDVDRCISILSANN
ncbi:uncharacterized protein [Diabrotica undecimpunctata]|uniref:uncharacterized protein n=1 Tax=Diabrotica undecimpunctata TaxID=50387 RepID=UPI003B63B8B2